MKNLFKFGFLGLALTIAFASCGGAETKTEQVADSLANQVEAYTDSIAYSINNVADSVKSTSDSIADSLNNVHKTEQYLKILYEGGVQMGTAFFVLLTQK